MTTYTSPDDGVFACVNDTMAAALSRCNEVQVFLEVATEAAALLLINVDGLDPPASADGYTVAEMEAIKPRVLLANDSGGSFTLSLDGVNSFDTTGQVQVDLVRAMSDEERRDPKQAIASMEVTMGRVAMELFMQREIEPIVAFDSIRFFGPILFDGDDANAIGAEVVGSLQITLGGNN